MNRHADGSSLMHTGVTILQSFLIIAIMGGMSALLVWSVFGPQSLIWGAAIAVFTLLLTPRISPRALLGMYGGRALIPEQAPELFDLVGELSRRAGLRAAPRLFLIPSQQANALSVGTKADSAVALTQGLLDSLTPRELSGVIAHEIGHIAAGDLWIMGLARMTGQITSVLAFLGRILLVVNLPLILIGSEGLPWLFVLLLIATPLVSAALETALSRAREYAADQAASDLTGDPAGFASALRKIDERSSLLRRMLGLPGGQNGTPLLSTHPPNEERIRRLLQHTPHGGPLQMYPGSL